jgi:hypothetical protein
MTDKTEIWLMVDADEDPIAYALTTGADARRLIGVEITGPTVTARLQIGMPDARLWAAELFAAVSVVYRQATGDPLALSDPEITSLVRRIALGLDETTPTRCRNCWR